MGIEDQFRALRREAKKKRKAPVPKAYQGVTKKRIRAVLSKISMDKVDIVDAVFALLDDQLPSFFPRSPEGMKFTAGATTAQIGSHVGILQRGGSLELDREGRDYWLKPLSEIGAIERVIYDSETNSFLPGHPIAKSPYSAYRLDREFVSILKEAGKDWTQRLDRWISEEAIRQRKAFQAEAERLTAEQVNRGHFELIQLCVKLYAPKFLPGYEVLYIDDADGDRITDDDRKALSRAGITIELGDAMPDVLLWNEQSDACWVIEAVTSDGEVDERKVRQVKRALARCGKVEVDFTTAYPSWSVAARCQTRRKNIASNTYLWLANDPSKHFFADAFPVEEE